VNINKNREDKTMTTITTTLTIVALAMTVITPVVFYATRAFLFLDMTTSNKGWSI
jgi:D-arabinose 5-phosphate isomerase GutQ